MSGNGTTTFQTIDKLKELLNIDDEKARGLFEIISQESISKADVELSTTLLKRDIKELDIKIETIRAELKKDIETTKSELKKDIETTKSELTMKIVAVQKDIKSMELSLRNDMLVKMISFSLAIISILGGLMAFFKFFQS